VFLKFITSEEFCPTNSDSKTISFSKAHRHSRNLPTTNNHTRFLFERSRNFGTGLIFEVCLPMDRCSLGIEKSSTIARHICSAASRVLAYAYARREHIQLRHFASRLHHRLIALHCLVQRIGKLHGNSSYYHHQPSEYFLCVGRSKVDNWLLDVSGDIVLA
jgi:hypothetical protein